MGGGVGSLLKGLREKGAGGQDFFGEGVGRDRCGVDNNEEELKDFLNVLNKFLFTTKY